MRYIPKIIHFIWFGKSEYPQLIKKCLESWKKLCPDYEFLLWNEDNFDISSNAFIQEAYENKKWAFVSDYVRLYVLYNYGGVYADSDCELIREIDSLLENEHVVTGYSTDRWIPTAFLAAEKGNIWIKKMLDYYTDRHFILKNGKMDLKPNNAIISEISEKELGFRPGKDYFISYGNVKIYPRHFFHPFRYKVKDITSDNINLAKDFFDINDETYCIHYSTGTWDHDVESRIIRCVKKMFRNIMPKPIVSFVENIYYRVKYWGDPSK